MCMVSSMLQRLEDYWLGLRLQGSDVPSIELVRAGGSDQPNCVFELTDALDQYLRFKGCWAGIEVSSTVRRVG